MRSTASFFFSQRFTKQRMPHTLLLAGSAIQSAFEGCSREPLSDKAKNLAIMSQYKLLRCKKLVIIPGFFCSDDVLIREFRTQQSCQVLRASIGTRASE